MLGSFAYNGTDGRHYYKQLMIADISRTCYNSNVYEPSDDSFALVDALQQAFPAIAHQSPSLCLEIGAGSGYVTCSLALLLQHHRCAALCLATDISPDALEATQQTLAAHHVTSADVIRCDLVGPLLLKLCNKVDILVFNPPYVPTPDEEVGRGGIAAAWAGGYKGRQVIDRVLPLVPKLLAVGGHLFMVTVPDNDPEDNYWCTSGACLATGILKALTQYGLQGSIALSRSADEEFLQILHVVKQPQNHTRT